MTATDRAMCTEAEGRAERYARLLWDCHCAASDGIPVPFERWLMDDGPEQMPTDVRELREAYDTVSEQQHEGEGENERLRDVDAAAERIFASGILDEIADAELDGTLAGRDAMQDAVTVARLALASDEIQDGGPDAV